MTEKEILDAYRRRDYEKPLLYLYHKSPWRRVLLRHITQNGGSKEDAEDVLQETIVAFNQNMKYGRFRQDASLKRYFVKIGEKTWLKKLKYKQRRDKFHEELIPIASANRAEELFGEDWREEYDRVLPIINKMNPKNKELLRLVASDWSHEEIANQLGYANANTSKSTLKRIRTTVLKALGRLQSILF